MDIKYVLLFQVITTLFTTVLATDRSASSIESGTFDFRYDPDTGFFVGSNRFTCILVLLDSFEREEVHTTNGIQRLELKMMKDWMGVLPEVMVFRTDPKLSSRVVHWCDNRHIIQLQRSPSSSVEKGATTLSWKTSAIRVTSEHTVKAEETGYTSETTVGTTTTELPASATSNHPVKVTSQSAFGPRVVYINSSTQVTAVIIEEGSCYMYLLSDTDIQLVNMGPDIKHAFERVLLSKDKTNARAASLNASGISDEIKRECTGSIFQIN